MRDFDKADEATKEQYHAELSAVAELMGGKFGLLSLIENIRLKSPHALLAKHSETKFDTGNIKWNKVIYPQNLQLLIARLESDEAILPKEGAKNHKKVLNMLKALAPLHFKVYVERKVLFDFAPFAEDGTPTLLFEAIFFRHQDFAKKILNHKSKSLTE